MNKFYVERRIRAASATMLVCGILLFPGAVFAAHAVPGNLPQTQPLQPIPVGAYKNIEKNIQYSPDKTENSQIMQTASGSLPNAAGPAEEKKRGTYATIALMIVCFLAAAGVIVMAIKHRHE